MMIQLRLKLKHIMVLFACILITACANTQPQQFLKHQGLSQPQMASFEVCAMVGCDRISEISLQQQEWDSITELFKPQSTAKIQERTRIAKAVALMENYVGAKNNTSGDLARNRGWFTNSAQLDCIAESANTTVTMLLLEQQGLIRFHRILYPSHRGLFSLLAPHNAAAVEEIDTGDQYVIDSWFYANGVEPIVVPVGDWKAGYDPDEDS